MSVVNRVWDTMAGPGFVRWRTPRQDTVGLFYPGPGTFGVDTSDYCVAEEREEQPITQPARHTTSTPLGTVQGLWQFDGNLVDGSGNGIGLAVQSGLTARYVQGVVPDTRGFFKASTGYVQSGPGPESNPIRITGALTVELLYRPHEFTGSFGGAQGFFFLMSNPGGGDANQNITWGLGLRGNTNEFMYLHEYGTGDPSIIRVDSGVFLEPGRWHHLAVTRDSAGTLIRLYVNGLMVHREVVGNAPAGGSQAHLKIGDAEGGTRRVDGTYYSARVIDAELRPEHILADARATLPAEVRP